MGGEGGSMTHPLIVAVRKYDEQTAKCKAAFDAALAGVNKELDACGVSLITSSPDEEGYCRSFHRFDDSFGGGIERTPIHPEAGDRCLALEQAWRAEAMTMTEMQGAIAALLRPFLSSGNPDDMVLLAAARAAVSWLSSVQIMPQIASTGLPPMCAAHEHLWRSDVDAHGYHWEFCSQCERTALQIIMAQEDEAAKLREASAGLAKAVEESFTIACFECAGKRPARLAYATRETYVFGDYRSTHRSTRRTVCDTHAPERVEGKVAVEDLPQAPLVRALGVLQPLLGGAS